MTRLGIVAALREEVRCLSDHTIYAGEIIELAEHTLLCVSGVGAQCAREAGQQLLSSGARALLSWGTAVALSSELTPGSLLLPTEIVAKNQSTVAVNRDWHTSLYQHLRDRFSICTQPLAETSKILFTRAEKQKLFESSAAVAADMESAALGVLAHASGVPFAVLRVTADTVDMRLPMWLPQSINVDGHIHIGALLIRLLKHPADWLSFMRISRSFRAANATMAAVIQQTGIQGLHLGNP